MGVGGRARSHKANIQQTKGSAVPSVGEPSWHAQLMIIRKASLAPHAVLLMPLRDHTGYEMHPYGLTALE